MCRPPDREAGQCRSSNGWSRPNRDGRAADQRSDGVMRIVVDRNQCESNALCVGILPEVFYLDDDDVLHVLDEHPAGEFRERVTEAARACPKQAITIEG